VSDILQAVSKASSNQQPGQPAQSFNVTLVMPSNQQPVPLAVPSMPVIAQTAAPAPVVTTESMSAVANSIQKEKIDAQEKHQNAVQKTLALALKAREI
tara:strand:- start:510 stop:803 length:294 start_codon:yes stop_codon:yes gene_type:complete